MEGKTMARMFQEFCKLPAGQQILEGTAEGKYLANRIEVAWQAGVLAAEENMKLQACIKARNEISELLK